jgi:hypothetical protein
MRCRICDADNARVWKDDVLCTECSSSIRTCVNEMKNTRYKRGELPILDEGFDDE